MATNGGCRCFELFPYTAEGREAARRIKRGVSVLRNEVEDWRESARKAMLEGCGDEVHCTCVGPLRHQIVRQAQQITEDSEEIAELYAENRKSEHLIASLRAKLEAVPVEEIRSLAKTCLDTWPVEFNSDATRVIGWLAGLGK